MGAADSMGHGVRPAQCHVDPPATVPVSVRI